MFLQLLQEANALAEQPRFYQVLLAAVLLLLWPIVLSWRSVRFEAGRWSESDHPFGGSGGSSDSDDSSDGEDDE